MVPVPQVPPAVPADTESYQPYTVVLVTADMAATVTAAVTAGPVAVNYLLSCIR